MQEKFWFAFAVSVAAASFTLLGSAIAFIFRKKDTSFLSFGLGMSGGIMIYIGFMDMIPESVRVLTEAYGIRSAHILSDTGFFSGLILTGIIDRLVPEPNNPHEAKSVREMETAGGELQMSCGGPGHRGQGRGRGKCRSKHADEGPVLRGIAAKKVMRTGFFIAAALTIHNFPEGIATFFSALHDIKVGIPIAVAIAIHNIPEGISVSVPIYCATGSKEKAFWYSALSGVAEPVGAVAAYFLLLPILNQQVLALIFSVLAGVMVYLSLDELLPTAREYGKGHIVITGIIIGMAIIALSLLLIK